MRKQYTAHLQAGFTLLEVLIATLVLSAGLLGLASLQIAGMKSTHNSYQMQEATWLVADLLERMRANKPGSNAGDYTDTANVDCTQPAATNCLTAQCTAAEMAAYDLHDVMCGYTKGSVTSGGIRNLLINGQLAVTCPNAGGCPDGVRISLQWDERNASRSAGADTENFSILLNTLL